MAKKKWNTPTGRHPGGRPKELDIPTLVKKFKEYVSKTANPLVCEFCYKSEIGRDAIYDNTEFSDTLRILKAKQRAYLIKNGLSKKTDSAMTRFLLNTNHGMSETTKQELTADITLDATIKQMSDKDLDEEIKKLK